MTFLCLFREGLFDNSAKFTPFSHAECIKLWYNNTPKHYKLKARKSIVFAVDIAVLAPFAAQAVFSQPGVISSAGRKQLKDGSVHTVTKDLTIKGGLGMSAMYLDGNAVESRQSNVSRSRASFNMGAIKGKWHNTTI